MIVAFVSDAVLPFNKGGKETRIYHLSLELQRLGYDVHIYTMQWWQGGRTFKAEGITYHAISRLYPLYTGDRRSIKEGVLFGLACLKLFRARFDVIEVDHMPYFPLYSVKLICILRKKRMYATWHEVWGAAYWKQYLGPMTGRIAYFIERFSVFLPDHIIAVSPRTSTMLTESLHCRKPISIIRNGIDFQSLAHIAPSTKSSDLIFTGRLLAHKHVDQLIEAVGRLTPAFPSIRCIIVGEGPESAALTAQIVDLGLEKHIVMTGRLDTAQEVFELMKASRIFVLPSTREGFGITVLEAIACGLSIVTVQHPDNAAQDLVHDGTGIVCQPNVSSLTDAIIKLLGAPEHTINQLLVNKYSWQESSVQLAKVYST